MTHAQRIEEQRAMLTMLLVAKGYPVPVFDKPYAYVNATASIYPDMVRLAIYYLSDDPNGIENPAVCDDDIINKVINEISEIPEYKGNARWE